MLLQRFLQQTWISMVLVVLLTNVVWRFYRVTFGEAWEIVMCIMDIFLLGKLTFPTDYAHIILQGKLIFSYWLSSYFLPVQLIFSYWVRSYFPTR